MLMVLWGFGALAVTLVAHVIVWRIFRPVHQYAALVALFGAVFGGALMVSYQLRTAALVTPTDYATFTLLYLSLAFAYFVTYPAAQAESPSLVILRQIHGAGLDGLKPDDLRRRLTDHMLVLARLEDLLVHRLAILREHRYVITLRGAAFASLHISYRDFLKMEKGG